MVDDAERAWRKTVGPTRTMQLPRLRPDRVLAGERWDGSVDTGLTCDGNLVKYCSVMPNIFSFHSFGPPEEVESTARLRALLAAV